MTDVVFLVLDSAQIEVTGSGQVALPKGVAIPGFYTFDTPGVVYDIYGDLVAAGKVSLEWSSCRVSFENANLLFSILTQAYLAPGTLPRSHCGDIFR